MVGVSGVCLLAAPRVLRGEPHFARGMVGGSVAYLMVEGSAQRACMVGPTSVSLMVGARDVLCQDAPRAPGGKRCRFENCGKSAQGSTDFCKAHGGGKRCTWAEGSCEKFASVKSVLCAAHASMVQDPEKGKTSGMLGPGLFCGLV